MQKKKILFIGLTASLLTGALIGCGKGGKGNSSIAPSSDGSNSVVSSVDNSSLNSSTGASSVYDPDDPNNSTSAGSIVRQNDFNRALDFKYNNYSLVYDQLYNNEEIEEYGYIYYVDGISYVLDYNYVESTGQYDYLYYATYKNDGYMYWSKADGYEYNGWVANGYHDSDLAMYNAYFDFDRFLHTITADDVEYILGGFYVKEASMAKYNKQGLEFFGDPFYQVEEIEGIVFYLDNETGAVNKIVGYCDENSDNGFAIQLSDVNSTKVPQGALNIKAPYYNSESDRNIYTYKEMKGAAYVEDVWPTSVTLKTVGEVNKEAGYDAVIDIAESVEVAYDMLPENVNRIEFNWVTSDETIVDLDYKQNFTSHHKYATGVKEGEAYVSIKLQKADGTWLESNKLKIKVKGLAEQDKTNAVYDLTITGSYYDTKTVGEEQVQDKNVTVFSAYNAVNTIAKYSIKGHNTYAYDAKNTDSFGDSGVVLVVSPANQDYMNSGFYSEVTFDFGDQEVVSMSFYYALYKSNQRGGALANMAEAYISTSSDGENWSTPIDIKTEMQNNFENVNLDYDAQQKLLTRQFTKASKVKLYFKASMVGNNYWIAMNSFVFQNDATCHNHTSDVIPVSSVNASSNGTKVKVGKSLQFGATVSPENATYSNVTWISSDPTVGTINAMGVFTGVAEGTTTVYAQAHNGVKSNEIEITVIGQEYLDSKYVGKKYLGNDVYYSSKFYDLTFDVLTNTTAKLDIEDDKGVVNTINFTYYTKDDSTRPVHTFYGEANEVLTVQFYDSKVEMFLSGSNLIELGNTHTNNGEELDMYVSASSISLTQSTKPVTEANLKVGETFNFFATVKPDTASYRTCTATSENDAVATVAKQENGSFTVTAVGAGETNIVVKNADNVQTKLKVTVAAVVNVTNITITASKTSLEVGQNAALTANITPTNANNMNLTWESSDSKVATVKGNGTSATVNAVKAGSATITVKDTVSGKSATVVITVTASTAVVDYKYVGVYSGTSEVSGEDFTFTVNADGTAVLEHCGDTFNFTVAAAPSNGDQIEFTYDDDPSMSIGIYNDTLTTYGDDCYEVFGITYGGGYSVEISKN